MRENADILLCNYRVDNLEDRDLYHAIIYAAMTRGELDIGGCRFGLMSPTPTSDDEALVTPPARVLLLWVGCMQCVLHAGCLWATCGGCVCV